MVSFNALFALVFVGLCFATLQVVLSFHGLRNRQAGVALYCAVFGFSIFKLVVCSLVRTLSAAFRKHNHVVPTVENEQTKNAWRNPVGWIQAGACC